MSFRIDANGLLNGLTEFENRTRAAIGLYGDSVAREMESYAKTHRKWTDRTGQARQTLNATSKWMGNKVRIELSYGVDYGLWLELANERKYSIITPTIDIISPRAISGLSRIIR